MVKQGYNPQNFIDLLSNFNFKIYPDEECSYTPMITSTLVINFWDATDETYWDFNIEYNGYLVKGLTENHGSIEYESYLEPQYKQFKLYYRDCIRENKIDDNLIDDIKFFIDDLNRLNSQFKDMSCDAIDMGGPYYKSHPLIKLDFKDPKKNSRDLFLNLCISIFLNQHQAVLSSTIKLLENVLQEIYLKIKHKESDSVSLIQNTYNVSWSKSDTDLLELIVALHDCGAIQNATKDLSQKEAISFFSEIFQKDIKDPHKKLNSARLRYKDNFIEKLSDVLGEYYKKQNEKMK